MSKGFYMDNFLRKEAKKERIKIPAHAVRMADVEKIHPQA